MNRILLFSMLIGLTSISCSSKSIILQSHVAGVTSLVPKCEGGVWASRTEHEMFLGITTGLAHDEALYFCCPGKGVEPTCYRTVWTDPAEKRRIAEAEARNKAEAARIAEENKRKAEIERKAAEEEKKKAEEEKKKGKTPDVIKDTKPAKKKKTSPSNFKKRKYLF